jgi:hypothetical protein
MPWKECSVMDERLQFVARRLAGEATAELCREFGISRKTGYRIFDRYQECGVQGLTDRSRRPYHYAHQLPFQLYLSGQAEKTDALHYNSLYCSLSQEPLNKNRAGV